MHSTRSSHNPSLRNQPPPLPPLSLPTKPSPPPHPSTGRPTRSGRDESLRHDDAHADHRCLFAAAPERDEWQRHKDRAERQHRAGGDSARRGVLARHVQQHEHGDGPVTAPSAVGVAGHVAALVARTLAGHDCMIQLDVGQTEEQQRSQQVAVNARHSRSSRLLPHLSTDIIYYIYFYFFLFIYLNNCLYNIII